MPEPKSPVTLQSFKANLNQPAVLALSLMLISVFSSLLLYIPLWFTDPTILYRFLDGPNYLYIAHTLYDIPADHPFVAYNLTPAYFACHLPLYPLLIRLLALGLGYPNGMLAATLISSAAATWLLYRLLRETGSVVSPFWSACVSLFLPVRWLIYHSIGASEPLFMALVLGSMLSFQRKRYALAFALCGLASTTRIVGVLLAVAYLILLLREKLWKQVPLLAISAIPLLATFSFYAWRFGDFWAYFSWNGKLIYPRPFDILISSVLDGKGPQAEFFILLYVVCGVGTALLWRRPLFFWYCALFWVFNLFVVHSDLSRYFIPIAPLALVVAYDQILSARAFRVLFPLLVLLAYLYSLPMLAQNVIPDWMWSDLLSLFQGA